MIDITAYAGLFFSALIAATLLPMQSEAVLVGLILASKQSPVLLIVVASLGNILGAVINWLMGRGIERFKDRTWFPAKGAVLERAQNWYSRYGKWSLLLSWLPIIGDPLTVIAGVMREPLRTFIVLVAIGKITRYIFIAAVTLKAM
ncbi:YqaA family protein [Pseudochrobactrum asaccharolyticum]|jgi:membrane protein YqaA with SNARE-associated domain|nr:YqaA family protein [Pseudochrobactrum asaccharolyticum]MDR2309728.1 DedA family protein [Brucellaceae bacterium]